MGLARSGVEAGKRLRARLLRIDPAWVTFARRGFPRTDPERVARLERVAAHFVRGYNTAIRDTELPALARELDRIEAELRGFAYEGAGMALEVLDLLSPFCRDRLLRFLERAGDAHTYMVHIGAGWAWARLRPLLPRLERRLARLDPLLGWFALDGYGFHEGFFAPERTFASGVRPRGLSAAMASAFDTGVGRSLWFVAGADPAAAADAIGRLAPDRRASLWAGCGLACAYAGGVPESSLRQLCRLAGPDRAALAQGAAFAAKARERAGNGAAHTELAVTLFCDMSAAEAARRCDESLAEATRAARDVAQPAFHAWRLLLQRELDAWVTASAAMRGAATFTERCAS